MTFIERLRQEQAAKALSEQRLKTQQEDREKERLQKEAVERERRAQRKQLAENFRKESEVGDAVAELGRFLATPTIPVGRQSFYDGIHSGYTELVGRGSSSGPTSVGDLPISQRDPDSVFDTVGWDYESHGFSKDKVMGSNSHHSKKYIAVESCPDGTIVFHGSWLGSTTIRVTDWRTNDRKQVFDKALEKAYKHPGIHRYSEWHQPVISGFG